MYTFSYTDDDGYPHCELVTEYRKSNGKVKYYSTIEPDELLKLKNSKMVDMIAASVSVPDQAARHLIIEAGGQEYDAQLVEYDYCCDYGGPEEGGWWYDCYTCPRIVTEENKNDPYVRAFQEFVMGEYETKGKPFYC